MNIINWWKNLCIFHVWSKWERYMQPMTARGRDFNQAWQKRVCAHCGKHQEVSI